MYVKIDEKNQQIIYPEVNKDNVCNYNLATDLLIVDGFVDVDEYLINIFNEGKAKIIEGKIVDITQTDEYKERILFQTKQVKLKENEAKRYAKLVGGLTYKNILFDSDTDQKANLMYALASMNDSDTITWYGINNDSLVCTKSDLLSLGQLIQELTSYVWGDLNPKYVNAINNASSIDELNALNIEY